MPSLAEPRTQALLRFGPFVLDSRQRLLAMNGQPVKLGSRAMELLCALAESPGVVLSREELEARAWPSTVVEATSLRVHIAALRKILGDGRDGARYITNVPGRGYCFVASTEATPTGSDGWEATTASGAVPRHNLPARLSPTIGRDAVTEALAAHLTQRRLVSIVGPGGIGKTTVAVATAMKYLANYAHGARFVDLAPLADPAQVPAALAATFGIAVPSITPLPALCAYLREQQLLVILDNCEHVIDAAATLAEAILKAAPQLHILVTSREPLDAEGEWVHRLAGLEVPAASEPLTVAQALQYPAIQLFVERAGANSDGFLLSDATLTSVRQVCCQLDGIALAIELAAARVDTLGVEGLAARLGDLFQLLTRGRRTALPRHRTLQALIDWSHELLNETERTVLRRLSVFRARFTLESAASVAACERIGPSDVMDTVMALAAKSLVNCDAEVDGVYHRLLHMTRSYAAAKLVQSGEAESVARRHAMHCVDIAKVSFKRWGQMSTSERITSYGRTIDDIRAGLDWAFSPKGDDRIGVALAASSTRIIFELGIVSEHTTRVELALDRVSALSPPQPEIELNLCAAWCFSSGQSAIAGRSQQDVIARALLLAEQTEDIESRIEMLYSICVGSFGQGNYPLVSTFAEQIRTLTEGPSDTRTVVLADRMQLLARHYLGDHHAALALLPHVLAQAVEPQYHWYLGQVPRAVSLRIVKARIQWITGLVDQATVTAREAVILAEGQHPFAICQALALAAIPIALWRGDVGDVPDMVTALEEVAARYSLGYWQSWARSYSRILELRASSEQPARAVDATPWTLPGNAMERDMLGTLSESLAVPETLHRVEAGTVGWCAPEILRATGENRLRVGDAGAASAAEALFRRALRVAGAQHALSWELRAACSLARLLRESRRMPMARDLLSTVCGRFAEGLGTTDLVDARELLESLRPADASRNKTPHV